MRHLVLIKALREGTIGPIAHALSSRLAAINVAFVREKSIRSGHSSTLHVWWARQPVTGLRTRLRSHG